MPPKVGNLFLEQFVIAAIPVPNEPDQSAVVSTSLPRSAAEPLAKFGSLNPSRVSPSRDSFIRGYASHRLDGLVPQNEFPRHPTGKWPTSGSAGESSIPAQSPRSIAVLPTL